MSINYYRDYVQQLGVTRDVEYFQRKFDCRVTDSKEYKQYVRRMPYNMWDGRVPFDVEAQVVPMKAIHLSSDNLDRLVAEQEHMERLQDDANFGKEQWTRERADRAVRDANPAVEKAYRNYQMLLELARK